MSTGSNQPLTEGSTEFSAHVATEDHTKEDFHFEVVMNESNWYKRGIKEAIAIKKLNPTLNLDEGRYHLSPIYNNLIRTSLRLKTQKNGT